MRLMLYCLISICYCSFAYKLITSKGPIRGTKVKSKQFGDYVTFMGIPYAIVDEKNPFGASKESPPFESEFEATNSSIVCPQINEDGAVIGEIQCLRLNIYVPRTATTSGPFPVLIWFRGEFENNLQGQHLLKHDILVVIANYRLGPYGFLCLNDPEVPGNQGLKDQYAALLWVSQNIPTFQGDRDKITIAGQGVSTELHLYSKQLKMFDKVIIHSGSAFGEGMYIRGDNSAAIKIAKYFANNVTNTRVAINVLAKIHPHALIRAASQSNLNLGPCVEKSFKHASNFLRQDVFHLGTDVTNKIETTKILVGYSNNVNFNAEANTSFENLERIFYDKLANTFNLLPMETVRLAKIVEAFYLGSRKANDDVSSAVNKFISDFTLNYPMEISMSNFVKSGAPAVYKWLFSNTEDHHNPPISYSKSMELQYLFDVTNKNITDEQKLLLDRMTTMWANFVKLGNPTPADRDKKLLPETWPSMTEDLDGRPCMNIGLTMHLQHQVNHERIAFWDLFWISYYKYYKFYVGNK